MLEELIPYWALLWCASALGLIRWNILSIGDKVICILMCTTAIEEPLTYIARTFYHTNLPVYHIYSPIELLLISLYFDRTLTAFRKSHIPAIVGFFSIFVEVADTLFIEPLSGGNTYFLLYEGTVIIFFCLLACYQILMDEERMPYRFAHFWVTLCFLLYWSVTFTGWGLYQFSEYKGFMLNPIFNVVLHTANFAFYAGISLIFLQYKKLIPSGA